MMNYRHIAICCAGTALALGLAVTAVAQETGDTVVAKSAGPSAAQAGGANVSCQANAAGQTDVASQADIACVGNALRQAAAEKRALTEADESWLQVLRRYWGRDSIVVPDLEKLPATRQVNCRLSVDYINAHPGALDTLAAAWNAMEAATKELDNPLIFKGNGYSARVHNSEIYPLLRQEYDRNSFEKLYGLVQAHGAFDLAINPQTGLVTTSDIAGQENAEMALRQWVTDTVRTGDLQRQVNPKSWPKALHTLAKFYTSETEQKSFDQCISKPQAYRQGGLEVGVAHIFYPNTLQRDPNWFNNKRLESHGLALLALCKGLEDCADHDPWAVYKVDNAYVQAIANLAAYFISIDYASAPSSGNWEETPFPGGLTWDSLIICSALKHLDRLLFDPYFTRCHEVVRMRNKLHQAKYGTIVSDRKKLAAAIAAGEKRVRQSYKAESPGIREMDASLAFMSATDIKLSDDNLESVAKYLDQLDMLEKKLVREDGMLRYTPFNMKLKNGKIMQSPDSYLTLNYNIACDPQGKLNLEWKGILDSFGSKDCSEPLVFAARAGLATPNREAEWFMVSDLARGYANQAFCVLRNVAERRKWSPEVIKVSHLNDRELALFKRAMQGTTRNINRAYARITDSQPSVKANGQMAGAWKVPEAWQSVSTLDGRVAYLPGTNTPLTWAAVSLWGVSQDYLELLRR